MCKNWELRGTCKFGDKVKFPFILCAYLIVSVVLHMEEMNLKPKCWLMLNIRLNHVNNTTKLGIAHMAKDANIYIRRRFNQMSFATPLKVASSLILRFMRFYMKSIDFVTLTLILRLFLTNSPKGKILEKEKVNVLLDQDSVFSRKLLLLN